MYLDTEVMCSDIKVVENAVDVEIHRSIYENNFPFPFSKTNQSLHASKTDQSLQASL